MKLTRRDLRGFDRMAQDLILEAQSHGVYVRVSRKHHAILRSKGGMTTSVSQRLHSAGRTAQNCKADVKKLIADHCGSN